MEGIGKIIVTFEVGVVATLGTTWFGQERKTSGEIKVTCHASGDPSSALA